jgi:hypothetical protein
MLLVSVFGRTYNIHSKFVYGSKLDANASDARKWLIENVPDIIKEFGVENVFNSDEAAFFFLALPQRTLVCDNDKVAGGAKDKSRFTFLLCVSMAGEKLMPLVIGFFFFIYTLFHILNLGKSKSPRSFGKHYIPVIWDSSANAWMTTEIFNVWATVVNKQMASQGRRICLLVDNFSAHVLKGEYSNIVIRTLEPNCTSLIQPLDAGIIACVKLMYRTELLSLYVRHAEKCGDKFKISAYDAVVLLNKCWNRVSASTIIDCWHYAGFVENALQLQFVNTILQPNNGRIRMPADENEKLKILRRCNITIYTRNVQKNVSMFLSMSKSMSLTLFVYFYFIYLFIYFS